MPYCKKCGTRLQKFDADRCPICGTEHPFEGVSSETIEITTEINEETERNFKPRKKQTMLALFIFLGFFGVPFFYLHEKKKGFIYMAINVIGIALISFIFAFYVKLLIPVAIIIGFAMLLFVNVGAGLYLYFFPNLKDGRGEFVL